MVFYVNGCRIKIEFSFLLIIAFSILLKTENLIYLILFASLHETGHITALLLFGKKPESITFSYFGIALKHRAQLSRNEELIFLLSGVLINLFFVLINVHSEINLSLFIINTLPVYPLDGGRALSLFVDYKILKTVSSVTVFILVIISVLTMNFSLMLISAYIIAYSFNEVSHYD